MNSYERVLWDARKKLLDEAADTLSKAYDADEALWSARACGQDTEEAENSGYLAGYRDGIEAVRQLLYSGDANTLQQYVGMLADEYPAWQTEAYAEGERCACGQPAEHGGGYGAFCG